LNWSRGDVKVKIKRGAELARLPTRDIRGAIQRSIRPPNFLAAQSAKVELGAAATPAPEPEEHAAHREIAIVERLYESPRPVSPPFVKVGDTLEVWPGFVHVEAMS